MKQISVVKTVLKLALVGVTGLLVACGGSSGSSSSSTDVSISGTIVAAPVNGAQVSVVDGNGNVVAGPVNTNATGQYALTIPNGSLAQDLIVKSTGGTFKDEATGNNGTAGEMFAYTLANSLSDGSSVSATPGSTIVAHLVMNHNKTMTEAQETFANAFGYTPDVSVIPADATGPAADATDASKLAGLRAAAFSQLARELGLAVKNIDEPEMIAEQFEMFAALAQDLSNGALDGNDASDSVTLTIQGINSPLVADIQNRFVMALLNFHSSGLMGDIHGNDLTGLTSDQIGNLPFAMTALTANYQIKYVPGTMGAMEGKTKFTLNITDSAGDGVPGLSPTLMPMMHMAGHMHSSPNLDCVAGATVGDYDCTVYYLMASSMAGGMSMGYWELMVMAGMGESATFYPQVMMSMGDAPKVTFQAQTGGTDKISVMGSEMNRKYFLFKESLTGMSDARTFTVFVAAMESMKSYPAVDVDTVLSADTDYELIANPMTVEFSIDGTSWNPANNDGNGLWSSGTDITGLVDGTPGEIYARVTINTELKTTDGKVQAVVDGIDNGYSAFTVTPGGM